MNPERVGLLFSQQNSQIVRVIIIHKVPPFNTGGAERVVWKTAKKFASSGHEVIFFSPNSEMDREPPDIRGIDFRWIETTNDPTQSQLEFFLRGSVKYPEVFNSVNPDLIYDNICPFPFHIAHFYGNVPVMSKVHAVYRMDSFSCKHHPLVKVGTILGEETYRLFSDERFVTNSKSTNERLSSLVNNRRNEIIANPIGIDTSNFEFNIAAESDTVLCLAKLTPRKDVSSLLEAWTDVEEQCPSANLVIAGSGPLESELRKKADSLNLSNVEFKGYVSDEEKQQLLSSSLIYVLPTIYEGFGLSNLEAMASGCPVISTETWGVKDYLIDGQNGLLVEPKSPGQLASALLRLLNERELVKKLAATGKETADEFPIEKALNRELALAEEYV